MLSVKKSFYPSILLYENQSARTTKIEKKPTEFRHIVCFDVEPSGNKICATNANIN
jgi:hypothetical protein